MSDYFIDPECEELYIQAMELPDGRARMELLEQAVRIADQFNDVKGAYMIRSELVETAVFHGYPVKAITHFSWQLGQFDLDPGAYQERSLLWAYKWIISNSMDFPEISLKQLHQLMEDMRDRYVKAGYSERTYQYNLFSLDIHCGEFASAAQRYERIKSMEREDISDCEACDQNEIVDYMAAAGRDQEALDAAQKILSGKLICTEVPELTHAVLLMPLYRLGHFEQADYYQKINYVSIADNRDYLRSIGEHIQYLTFTDPFKGLEIYEKHASWAQDIDSPVDRMFFHAYAAGLFKRLSLEDVTFQIRLPEEHPYPHHAENVSELAVYLETLSLEIAKRFDQRNQNQYYTSYMKKLVNPVQ